MSSIIKLLTRTKHRGFYHPQQAKGVVEIYLGRC